MIVGRIRGGAVLLSGLLLALGIQEAGAQPSVDLFPLTGEVVDDNGTGYPLDGIGDGAGVPRITISLDAVEKQQPFCKRHGCA